MGEKQHIHVVVSRATALLKKLITWRDIIQPSAQLLAYKTPSKEELQDTSDEYRVFEYEISDQKRSLIHIAGCP